VGVFRRRLEHREGILQRHRRRHLILGKQAGVEGVGDPRRSRSCPMNTISWRRSPPRPRSTSFERFDLASCIPIRIMGEAWWQK